MKSLINIGQAYRPAGVSATSRAAAWIIEALYTGIDGRQYAKLVNVTESNDLKTVGIEALADGRLFTPVAG